MKKSLLAIIAVIAIAGIVAFLVVNNDGFTTANKPQRAEIDKAFVCYFNIEQLAQKGAFDKHITHDQRRLAASIASANIDDSEVAAHTEATIVDLATSGIDINKPIYGYFDIDAEAMVFVAEVTNVDNLDKTVGILSYIAEQEDATHIDIDQIEDDRYVYLNDAILCYNATRAAFVVADDATAQEIATKELSSPLLDLSLFGDSDIAIYVDIDTMIDLADSSLTDDDTHKDIISELRENFTEDAYFVSSATFNPGRAIIHSYFEGINRDVNNASNREVTLQHLNYINDSLLAVMGGSINGLKCAEFLQAMLNSEHIPTLDNETRMALAIALDALETIDGDVTLALQSLEGEYKEYIDYYWGDVAYRPIIRSASGALMADVTDTYIISNVGQFTTGLLRKVGDSHYTGAFGNYNIELMQHDNLLFAGINHSMQRAESPASGARWSSNIDNSAAYLVIDVDNLMKSSFIESYSKAIVNNIEYPQIYTQLTQKLSYIYLTIYNNGSSDLVFVMDDATTNSLEQLNDTLLPIVVSELIKSVM